MDREFYLRSYSKYKELYKRLQLENNDQNGGMRTFSSGNKLVLNVDQLFISTRYMKQRDFFITDLEHVLDEIVWGKELGLTPKQVMKVKSMKRGSTDRLLKSHQKRIEEAKFSFPIFLMSKQMAEEFGFAKNYPYKYMVIDGVHRISKAYKTNKKKLIGILLTRDVIKEALVKI